MTLHTANAASVNLAQNKLSITVKTKTMSKEVTINGKPLSKMNFQEIKQACQDRKINHMGKTLGYMKEQLTAALEGKVTATIKAAPKTAVKKTTSRSAGGKKQTTLKTVKPAEKNNFKTGQVVKFKPFGKDSKEIKGTIVKFTKDRLGKDYAVMTTADGALYGKRINKITAA